MNALFYGEGDDSCDGVLERLPIYFGHLEFRAFSYGFCRSYGANPAALESIDRDRDRFCFCF